MTAIHNARMEGRLPSIDLIAEYSLPGHVPVVPLMCGAWVSQEVLDLRECNKQDLTAIAEANRYGQLPSVKRMHLSNNKDISGQVGALLRHPWNLLQILGFDSCGLITDDIKAIAEGNFNNFLPQLKQLIMSNNPNLSGMFGHFFSQPWLIMQKLDATGCKLNIEDMTAIHTARMEGKLPSIDVKVRCSLPGHVPVVPVICGAGALQEELDLNGHYPVDSKCDNQDLTTIGEANRYGQLPSVKRINLHFNYTNISGQVGALLCGSWSALEDLDFNSCYLTCRDVEALDQANQLQHLPCLKKLSLWGCEKLSGQGLITLLSHTWSTLQQLVLEDCSLTAADGDTLLEACIQGHLPQLGKLDISRNDGISGACLSSLLSHTWFTLQELDLRWCSLTAAECNTLLEACRQGRLPQLCKLDISYIDGISGAGLSSLLSHTWPTLQELGLWDCSLTTADGDTLLEACRQGRLPQLSKLTISGFSNKISSDMKDKLRQYIKNVS